MFDNNQNMIKSLGKNGCLVLCLIQIAENFLEERLNLFDAVEKLIAYGAVKYNDQDENDPNNFFVNNALQALFILTNQQWVVNIRKDNFFNCDSKYSVFLYEWFNEKGRFTHFEMAHYKPILNSRTVKNGRLIESREYKPVNW